MCSVTRLCPIRPLEPRARVRYVPPGWGRLLGSPARSDRGTDRPLGRLGLLPRRTGPRSAWHPGGAVTAGGARCAGPEAADPGRHLAFDRHGQGRADAPLLVAFPPHEGWQNLDLVGRDLRPPDGD